MNFFSKKIKRILVASIAVLCVIGVFQYQKTQALESTFVEYAAVAQGVVDSCKDTEHRPTCYDKEIPLLMDAGMTMEGVFEVTREVQALDTSYRYCHVLGHYLAAKETAKDPSKWKDVVARAPRGLCSNGAIHGAFQERFRNESFTEEELTRMKGELMGVCEAREGWTPTPMEEATCTHALGHLAMYVTSADIDRATTLCMDIAAHDELKDLRRLCFDGAFMQLFQPLEPDDFALIEGKEIETKEETDELCSAFSGTEQASCVRESWSLWREELREPDGVTQFCARVPMSSDELTRCENSVFYILTAHADLSIDWVTSFCPRVEERLQGRCFAQAASRMLEVDYKNISDAGRVCAIAEEKGVGAACFEELVVMSYFNFVPGSKEFYELCSTMPDPWQKSCLLQYQP